MFRAFAPIIRSTRLRLAAYGILSYLQTGGGVNSRRVGRVCGADVTAVTADDGRIRPKHAELKKHQ
jgi:hypothetical protein